MKTFEFIIIIIIIGAVVAQSIEDWAEKQRDQVPKQTKQERCCRGRC